MTAVMRTALWATCCLLGAQQARCQEDPVQRNLIIRNNSGHRVEINWIDPTTQTRHLMSEPDILTGADMNLDSYVTHNFEVKELPKKKTGQCASEECQTGFFTVNENQNQEIIVDRDFNVIHEDSKTKAKKEAVGLLEDCTAKMKNSIADSDDHGALLDQFSDCISNQVERKLVESAEEVTFQAEIRKEMGKKYETYTCFDDELNTTEPKLLQEYHSSDGKVLTVKVMLDRPASKIHVIEDFISEEECQAMEDAAAPILERAVVSDGAGGSTLSENRKAMQAGIKVPWEKEKDGHPIAQLSRRVYEYANDVLGLEIEEDGQEDLMSIQYFGKGEGKGASDYDQYTPHCDGECLGDPLKEGGRVATMVVYCTVPAKGGATNFRNSGIHVHPVKGNAVFFSYYNPDTGNMDTGFTEHSGCPVVEGEKKIVTQWIRLGVDKENPWDSFNTLGLKAPDMREGDEEEEEYEDDDEEEYDDEDGGEDDEEPEEVED